MVYAVPRSLPLVERSIFESRPSEGGAFPQVVAVKIYSPLLLVVLCLLALLLKISVVGDPRSLVLGPPAWGRRWERKSASDRVKKVLHALPAMALERSMLRKLNLIG